MRGSSSGPRRNAPFVGRSSSTASSSSATRASPTRCCSRLGRLAEAEQLLREAERIDPLDEQVRFELGRVLIAANRPSDVIAILEPLRTTDSDSAARRCISGPGSLPCRTDRGGIAVAGAAPSTPRRSRERTASVGRVGVCQARASRRSGEARTSQRSFAVASRHHQRRAREHRSDVQRLRGNARARTAARRPFDEGTGIRALPSGRTVHAPPAAHESVPVTGSGARGLGARELGARELGARGSGVLQLPSSPAPQFPSSSVPQLLSSSAPQLNCLALRLHAAS